MKHGKKQDLKNNPKIKLGNVELGVTDEEFRDRRNYKHRITTWIDGDILAELKRRAGKGESKGKYQKLMNQMLRGSLFGEDNKTVMSREMVRALLKRVEEKAIERANAEYDFIKEFVRGLELPDESEKLFPRSIAKNSQVTSSKRRS